MCLFNYSHCDHEAIREQLLPRRRAGWATAAPAGLSYASLPLLPDPWAR